MPLRIAVIALAVVIWAGQPAASSAQRQDVLDTSLVVRFLDAGDGEAVWITTPSPFRERRSTILIDCGPPGFGGRLALQLQTAKVPQIDSLILSGAGDELIGGCADLLQQVPIQEIRWTGQRGSSPVWATFEGLLQAQGWFPSRLTAQDVLSWGDVRATVLNPPQQGDIDSSLAMEIDFAHWGILYAGDIHAQTERQIQSWFESNALAAVQVLKVADHGSTRASTLPFLRAVFSTSAASVPRTAVITNGSTAWSAVVEQPVLDNLKAVGAEAINTADHGTVTIVVHPELGPRAVTER